MSRCLSVNKKRKGMESNLQTVREKQQKYWDDQDTPQDRRTEMDKKYIHGDGYVENPDDFSTRRSEGYNFRTPVDNTLTDAIVLQYANKLPSVGRLQSSVCSGTAFRVGTRYAMTTWHIVDKIIDPHGTKIYDYNKLNKPGFTQNGVYITFGDASTSFNLKGLNIFTDKDLDISVLEFSDDASLLPPPLPLLSDDVFGENNLIRDVAIIGYGHHDGKNKVVTPSATILRKKDVEEIIKNGINVIKNNRETYRSVIRVAGNDTDSVDRGYNGYDSPDRILFDSFVGPGASGSPILSKEDPSSLKVVGVFKSGYPEFAYHLPPQRKFDQNYTFEMGTKLSSIYKSMASRDQNLADNLF